MMSSSRVLFIILSGPDDIEKARQGLRIARNLAKEKHVAEITVLFLGPGAMLLDPSNPHYNLVKHYAEEMKQFGVKLLVCAGNLRAYNIYDKLNKNLFIADDSTAVIVEAIMQKFAIISF